MATEHDTDFPRDAEQLNLEASVEQALDDIVRLDFGRRLERGHRAALIRDHFIALQAECKAHRVALALCVKALERIRPGEFAMSLSIKPITGPLVIDPPEWVKEALAAGRARLKTKEEENGKAS